MHLRRLAKGDRAGFMGADVHTMRIIADQYNKQFFDGQLRCYLVRSFAEFKEAFLRAQQEVDFLLFRNHSGITGWDAAKAEAFVAAHTAVPTGTVLPWMQSFNLLTIAKVQRNRESMPPPPPPCAFSPARALLSCPWSATIWLIWWST